LTSDEDANVAELLSERRMAASSDGLSLEGTHLPSDLAHEIA
jgi:hypothetical protein